MASIFKDLAPASPFWQVSASTRPQGPSVLMSGVLSLIENPTSVTKTYYFYLTRDSFLQSYDDLDSSPIVREAKIRWVTVLPFTEYADNQTHFGLSIKHRDDRVDFFVPSEGEMEGWVRAFERTSILQDIEDDYSIGEMLGSGGQSVVYLGEELDTGNKVAIKSFEKLLLRESEKRFVALIHEIDVLRDLSHPRIVALYRVYESLTHVQLVMEYIPGEELFNSLSLTGAFSQDEAKGFMMNLLEVLKYMETQSIVHRDLKPENIILTDEGDKTQFKLIDFGFATKHFGKELQDTCGSPGYVAPEIILKHKHGASVDIYSAGVIFYILLCGFSPFYSTKKAEVIKKNAKNEISFTGVWLNIDPRLVRMIKGMTNFNAKLRSTAGELMSYLAGQPTAIDFASRRGSVVDPERLPPLRQIGITPKSPQPNFPRSPVPHAVPVTPSRAGLQAPKSQLRWANLKQS